MAKPKFEQWITEEGLLLIEAWCRDGLTYEQIAEKIGICRDTLNEWKKQYTVISDALKKGREVADITIENALFKKACGYKVKVKKVFKVHCVDYDPNNGRKLKEYDKLQEGEEEVYVPADTTAQIFWLKNRKPKEWRDRVESKVELDGKVINIVDDIAECD